ncbi:MAG: hypothetical protein A2W91_15840 [Bacteroidetes bacterium GWF2_38_335]|nr:MAG: hypothetical protein A2W91_15840 [Bacteroidetes bacterium GWF2_38_335]OFY81165.1 MAG: hypothetical protein A2281_06815 [Bacteroidetes bacterium RIFOXYA12_FULL_38_20]HBS85277.1 hypothetical protein [Bacteroidales bacterium]
MRSLLLATIICFVLASCDNNQQSNEQKSKATTDTISDTIPDTTTQIDNSFKPIKPEYCLTFDKDSGFILGEEGRKFVFSASLSDTVGAYWDKNYNTNLAGKYYKTKNGSVFLCIRDMGKVSYAMYFIMEIKNDGTIISCETYGMGSHECCWDKEIGFYKINDFYYFKSCGTGTAFCSTDLYVFKSIIPQNEISAIWLYYWSGYPADKEEELTGKLKIVGDTIVVNYKWEQGVRNEENRHFMVKNSDKFTVKYVHEGEGNWRALDSTKIYKYGI